MTPPPEPGPVPPPPSLRLPRDAGKRPPCAEAPRHKVLQSVPRTPLQTLTLHSTPVVLPLSLTLNLQMSERVWGP